MLQISASDVIGKQFIAAFSNHPDDDICSIWEKIYQLAGKSKYEDVAIFGDKIFVSIQGKIYEVV